MSAQESRPYSRAENPMKSGIASNETASAMPNDPLRNTCIRYIKSYTGSVHIRTRLKLQIVQPAKRAGAAPGG